jgi:glycosyltransferase involved in cell wall biosynthesis
MSGDKQQRSIADKNVRPRVSVVVPALNEAENLRHVLPRVAAEYEVVLVDGGSGDGTIDAALTVRPDIVVVAQDGAGKGNALRCGFAAARGEIIVMLDADGSARPEEIPTFVNALERGADYAKGSRFLPGAGGAGSADITPLRWFGNWFLGRSVNALFGTAYTDLCYGYNAFWKRCLDRLAVDCDGFEVETLLNIRAATAGYRIVEVPSFEDRRLFGKSNLRTFRDGWRVLRTILAERWGGSLKVIESAPRREEAVSADAPISREMRAVGRQPPDSAVRGDASRRPSSFP